MWLLSTTSFFCAPPKTPTSADCCSINSIFKTWTPAPSRMKRQVKHLELNYQAPRNNRGEAANETAALFDGVYNGENVDSGEELLRHAVGFFKGGCLYMLPIEESYELQRKIAKRKTDKNGNDEEEFVGKGKIDDSKLLEIDAAPSTNPVRVAFARNETEWQKKRREQSAQHRQHLIDSDPWIKMNINKLSARKAFESKVKKSEEDMPAK
ncbi:hypothetical protein M3Y97_00976200 [Aphelenchoides bicaudatus]|nr:hypothetical protein M3Y97_00976200 [Aphelenchoides bicaudatus]